MWLVVCGVPFPVAYLAPSISRSSCSSKKEKRKIHCYMSVKAQLFWCFHGKEPRGVLSSDWFIHVQFLKLKLVSCSDTVLRAGDIWYNRCEQVLHFLMHVPLLSSLIWTGCVLAGNPRSIKSEPECHHFSIIMSLQVWKDVFPQKHIQDTIISHWHSFKALNGQKDQQLVILVRGSLSQGLGLPGGLLVLGCLILNTNSNLRSRSMEKGYVLGWMVAPQNDRPLA